MASSLFEIDDQTDEDFFDKLIEDEVKLPQTSNASSVHETRAVSDKKLVTDATQTVVDSHSGSNLDVSKNHDGNNTSLVGAEIDQHYSDIKSIHQASEVRFNDVNTISDCPVDSTVGESNTSLPTRIDDETVDIVNKEGTVSPGAGIREVDWSAFNSQSHVQSNSGIGSYSDFFVAVDAPGGDPFANLDNGSSGAYVNSLEGIGENSVTDEFLVEHPGVSMNTHGQDIVYNQSSENLYPGWIFDPDTGLWHQLDNHDAISNDNLSSHNVSEVTSVSDNQVGTLHVLNFDHLQDSSQSSLGISEEVSSSAHDLSHMPQSGVLYPENMVFDPQYPGWYYDTTIGEWRSLESYTMSVNKSEISDLNQQSQSTYISTGGNNQVSYGDSHKQDYVSGSTGSFPAQAATSSAGKQHNGQNIHMWQPELVSKEEACTSTAGSQNTQSYHFEGYSDYKSHQFLVHSSDGRPESTSHQPTIPPSNQWSSDRRPYHPLVTFGFGGKLILMKSDNHFGMVDAYDTQTAGRVIDILSLSNIFMDQTQNSCAGLYTTNYFAALCQQSFPGPLVGGSAGMKDINKWVEEKITNFGNSYSKECENMKLLFALLKVACQHYGKLRSPFGGDYPLPGKEPAEIAVGNLFASINTNSRVSHGTMNPIIQNWPSEGQVQAAVYEMQNLLISGRKKEALECAKLGHLWGPAIALAAQLGDQVQAIKDRLRDEADAIPKAAKLIEASLKQRTKLTAISSYMTSVSMPLPMPHRFTTSECSKQEEFKSDINFSSLRLEDEVTAVPKEKKGRPSAPLRYVTAEELDSVPPYMKGRLTLEKINTAINDMAAYAEANAQLISAPKKKMTESVWEKALELRDIAMNEGLKGKYFFLESDIKGSSLKLDNTGKAILTVLRHLGRISETRIRHHRVIILLKP